MVYIVGHFSTFLSALNYYLYYQLYSAKKRAVATRHTEKVINRLIRSTVETGTITSICAVLELGFAVGLQLTDVHIALFARRLIISAFT